MRASFPILDARRRRPALDVEFGVASGREWQGMSLLMVRGDEWAVDDFVPERHLLGFNAGAAPLTWEARTGARFSRVRSDPGGFWFCPAGTAFSHRVAMSADITMVMIEPQQLDRWTGDRRLSLSLRYGLQSPQLSHVSRALAAEARQGGPHGGLFVDALGSALAAGLAPLIGDRLPDRAAGLSASRLRHVLDYIETELGSALPIPQLAAVACLSPAHFSRAFRAATGVPPHRFVLERRLLRARSLLASGRRSVDVAAMLGFTDQSHFTRCFGRRFGVTPGRIERQVSAGRRRR